MSAVHRVLASIRRGSVRTDIKGKVDSWRQDRRRLAASADRAAGTPSSLRVNRYAASLSSATSYLEVGIEHGYTLEAVTLSTRVGVDPRPMFSLHSLPAGLSVHPTVSDKFFDSLPNDTKFDVVFLDGLHTYGQTYRDLINSLRHLHPGGVIVIDDVVPSDDVSAMPDLDESIRERLKRGHSELKWHGDVFRIIPLLRDHHPELHFRTVVGAGNEQTILWTKNSDDVSLAVDEATLREYGQLSYEETFAHGIPDFFNPGNDEEILREFEQARRSH